MSNDHSHTFLEQVCLKEEYLYNIMGGDQLKAIALF